jgi:hypothetical protein
MPIALTVVAAVIATASSTTLARVSLARRE